MESLNDRYYIAKLERLLEERKDLINELITICEDLVKEKDELSDYADKCHADNVSLHQTLSDEYKRFDDLAEERYRLAKQLVACEYEKQTMRDNYEQSCGRFDDLITDYHILDQEHSLVLSQIENLKLENKNLHNKVKDLKRTVNELKAENEYLKTEFKHYDAIIDGGIIV